MVDSSNSITNGLLSKKKFKFKPLLVSKMNKGDRYYCGIGAYLSGFKGEFRTLRYLHNRLANFNIDFNKKERNGL